MLGLASSPPPIDGCVVLFSSVHLAGAGVPVASGIAAGEVVASVLTGGTAVEAPVSVPALVFDFDFDVDSF